MLRVCLTFAVCIALAMGQEETGQIVATFEFFNVSQVPEDVGVFEGCVDLDQSPSTDINITVVAAGVADLAVLDVNFGNPMPSILTFTQTSDTRMCFEVPIIEDGVVQPQLQIFSLTLETTAPNVELAEQEFIFIANTDVLQVSFDPVEYTVDESSPVTVCVAVVEGQVAPDITLTTTASFMPLSAQAGSDYVPDAVMFSFTSDNVRDCRPISIIDDPNVEGTEQFQLELGNDPPIEPVQNTATINITDNDGATIGFDSAIFTVLERDFGEVGEVDVNIVLSITNGGILERQVFGRVVSEDITATGGVDYESVDQSFTFNSGSRDGDIYPLTVTITGDNQLELEETFRLRLTSPSGDTVNPNTAVVEIGADGDANTCLMLRNITNGQVVISGFDESDTATYSCDDDNFVLNTLNFVRTCQINGTWTGEEPQCLPICMGYDIDNGDIVYTRMVRDDRNVEGDLATADCDTGYEVSAGDEVRTCQNDNIWSGTEQVCTLVDCGALTDIGNGAVTHSNTVFGSTAIYSCNPRFRLVGNSSRTCTEDGVWSGEEPECSGARSLVSAGALMLILVATLATLMGKQ